MYVAVKAVQVQDGFTARIIYPGGPLPAGTDRTTIKRLLERGLIKSVVKPQSAPPKAEEAEAEETVVLSNLTAGVLRQLAVDRGVDVGGATTKRALLALLED